MSRPALTTRALVCRRAALTVSATTELDGATRYPPRLLAQRIQAVSAVGDDPTRSSDAASRRAYAGSAPITRASGKSHVVTSGCNRRLADACRWSAFSASLTGARAYHQARRGSGDSREVAVRRLANKLLGQLRYCLANRASYDEQEAWTQRQGEQAA